MKCIVGLGNPGKEYEKTRHNAGFMTIDKLCDYLNVSCHQKKFNAHYVKTTYQKEDVLLVKPQTYMNLSGEAVSQLLRYYKIEPKDCLIISDDLDLAVGKIRFREKGSDGGQKGVRSILHHLSTQEVPRCKLGIGNNKLIPTAEYVLGKIEKESLDLFNQALEMAAKGCLLWVHKSIQEVMNHYNGVIK